MKYQPTETELKEMGFVTSVLMDDNKKADWFIRSSDNCTDLIYSKGQWFVAYLNGEGVEVYPTSKSDIQCLIKLLTP